MGYGLAVQGNGSLSIGWSGETPYLISVTSHLSVCFSGWAHSAPGAVQNKKKISPKQLPSKILASLGRSMTKLAPENLISFLCFAADTSRPSNIEAWSKSNQNSFRHNKIGLWMWWFTLPSDSLHLALSNAPSMETCEANAIQI